MIVLGIDPGTATTGYGAIKLVDNAAQLISYGLVETKNNGSPENRLFEIYEKVDKVIMDHSPDIVAIEKLFFAINKKTAIRVGQACGVIMLAVAKNKIPAVEYAPGEIKKRVAGSGRATKDEIQKAVQDVLGAKVRKTQGNKTHFDNSADALAIALYHLYKGGKIDNNGKN